MSYYSLEEIHKKKDLDGEEPAVYMVVGNRTGGKTTSVLLHFLNEFRDNNKQCLFIYRVRDEMSAVNKMYDDVLSLYPGYADSMQLINIAGGIIKQIFIKKGEDTIPFGFAVSLNDCDKIKKYSAIFAKVDNALFDEFLLENGRYLKNEIDKLQSIIITISRGGGQQSRPIKLYMLGNMVTILNPYYVFFGIHKRLRNNTKFLRGRGWVFECNINISAQNAIKNNPVNKAFAGARYNKYAAEAMYLSDATAFIQSISGKSTYLFTIVCDSKKYAVREYNNGIIYVDYTVDDKQKNVFTFNPLDHATNVVMLAKSSYVYGFLLSSYNLGLLRFKDANCKNIILDILSINL